MNSEHLMKPDQSLKHTGILGVFCSDVDSALTFRYVSVTTWTRSSSVLRRRRTGGARGRSLLGIAAGSCGAARRLSRTLPTVCSLSTAGWCSSA